MHRNPIAYLPLEILEEFSESALTARREAEMVRRKRELNIKGVNFCELKKKENKALKANWVAQRRE